MAVVRFPPCVTCGSFPNGGGRGRRRFEMATLHQHSNLSYLTSSSITHGAVGRGPTNIFLRSDENGAHLRFPVDGLDARVVLGSSSSLTSSPIDINTGSPVLFDLLAGSGLLCLLPVRMSATDLTQSLHREYNTNLPVQITSEIINLDLGIPRRLLHATLPLHSVRNLTLA